MLDEQSVKSESRQLINELITSINAEVQKEQNPHCSLTSGLGGIALLNGYYGILTGNDLYTNHCASILDRCIELSSDNPELSFSNGLTGLSWLITHLTKLQVLDNDALEVIVEIDDVIYDSIELDVQNSNYDLFSGLIGKGIYFMESYHRDKSKKALEKIVNALVEISYQDYDGIFWNDVVSKRDSSTDVIQNLGMAHGMPGIISFLVDVYKLGIQKITTERLIHNAINWLLSKRINKPTGYFPQGLVNNSIASDESRLAWCFGDLGIAFALLKANDVFQQKHWKIEAISALSNAVKRDVFHVGVWSGESSTKQRLLDVGFCHGISGISFLLKKSFKFTNEDFILKNYQQWYSKIFEFRTNITDSLCGYLSPEVDDNSGVISWVKNPYLITGMAGTCFTMLSSLYPDQKLGWEKIFLVN